MCFVLRFANVKCRICVPGETSSITHVEGIGDKADESEYQNLKERDFLAQCHFSEICVAWFFKNNEMGLYDDYRDGVGFI